MPVVYAVLLLVMAALYSVSMAFGAFIVRGDGVIMSAGTFLRPERAAPNLASGLGARHAAAAAITLSDAQYLALDSLGR